MIYLDNAATTPTNINVLKFMAPYLTDEFFNPSSSYSSVDASMQAINTARSEIAQFINAKTDEIYFTSGGSESNNWAIKGVAFANAHRGKHIITSKIEHKSILNACKWLENQGFEVTYLDVYKQGCVNWEKFRTSLRKDTILASIMLANNEIGTLQPIREFSILCRDNNTILHTDATQAYGQIDTDVKYLGCDLLTASGHKINAPKGVGILYIKNGTAIDPLIHGGSQERGMRGGTYNVPGIVGIGEATRIHSSLFLDAEMRDYFIKQVQDNIPIAKLNGSAYYRLPNNINFRFEGLNGTTIAAMLDMADIYVSTGSACNSSSGEPSYVLKAIGLSDEEANSSVRFTISPETTKEEIDIVVKKLIEITNYLEGIK